VKEVNLWVEKTSDELAKATTELASMQIDYDKVGTRKGCNCTKGRIGEAII
jgi:hypothetical protein